MLKCGSLVAYVEKVLSIEILLLFPFKSTNNPNTSQQNKVKHTENQISLYEVKG